MSKIPEKQAYDRLVKLCEEAETICKTMTEQSEPMPGTTYKSTPFDYVTSEFKSRVAELRRRLIDRKVRELNEKMSPNYHPDVNFVEIMDRQAGETEYQPYILRMCFEGIIYDKEEHERLCRKEIIFKAGHLLPYRFIHYNEPYNLLEKPKVLLLQSTTWSHYGNFVSLPDITYFEALEKLINHAVTTTPFRTVPSSGWLTRPMQNFRAQEYHFYGKHKIHSFPPIVAFQFYKNDNFRVWFKDAETAKKVAELLKEAKA